MGDLSNYIAAILVVVGWIVFYRQTLAIKRREEILEIVRLSTTSIATILKLCADYYTVGNTSHISYVSAQMKGEFHLLSRYLLLLKAAGLRLTVTEGLVRFKMLATGSHFETVNFLQQLSIPHWQEELTMAGLSLRYGVERSFFDWTNQKLSMKALLLPS